MYRTFATQESIILHTARWIVAAAFVLFSASTAMAGEAPILQIKAEGLAPIIDDDVKSAKNLAIQLARLQAIKDGVCRDISTESLMVHLRLSGDLTGSIPHCKIIENTVLEDGPMDGAAHTNRKGTWPVYRHQIQASVVEIKTQADSKFRIDARLNHTRFQAGQDMVVRVVPTMPCYCYIYVILENGQIIQLLPNPYISSKRIGAGQTLMFPDAQANGNGIKLTTQLPYGQKVATEMVFIVALKASARPATLKLENPIGDQGDGAAGYFDLLAAQIATIPANLRSEMILPYQIVEKKH